jgi:uncharacterized NAD(P)/FAD-binding protein YdhS
MKESTIAVIGAGFSGTLLSLWLQSSAPAATRIRLIEQSGRFGVGTAYSSDNPNHLLNVPAGRMSAFPDLPLDFVGWLRRQHPERLGGILPTESAFVPRRLYGAYLQHLLDCALLNSPTRLELVHDRVVGGKEHAGDVTLITASGASLIADIAVLAVGNTAPLPVHPDISAVNAAGLWRGDPWEPEAFTALEPRASVVLIGTGLTMVDAVITLLDAGHTGSIYALSRHGLLPRRHAAFHAAPVALPTPLPHDLASLTCWVRREVARALQAGAAWQPVIDSLRPVATKLWRGWSAGERRRFLRHMRPWWDVHRHRMSPHIADGIEAAEDSGNVDGGQANVVFRRRESGSLQTLRAARVIDCTGSGTDVTQSADRLLQTLLRSGAARPDPLRLGLDVSPDGAVLGRTGVASKRLFAIGTLTTGANWEITAVPDIRCQCRDMAGVLGNLLAEGGRSDHHAAGPAGQRTRVRSPQAGRRKSAARQYAARERE